MSQSTINRYQAFNPDTGTVGDIFGSIAQAHGLNAATACAKAALTGDERNINAALAPYQSSSGNATAPQSSGPTTTLGVLATYSPSDIANNATDYWSAQANSVGKNLFANIFGNSLFYFLAIVGGVVLFFYLDGPKLLKFWIGRKARS